VTVFGLGVSAKQASQNLKENDMSENKQATLITGASSGIGREVAIALLQHGFAVTLVARRKDALEETIQLAGKFSGEALPLVGDVSDPASVKRFFGASMERFGRLDMLFNNAGINAPSSPLEYLSFDHWTSVVSINLAGSFLCAQEAVRIMKAQSPKGGRIINNGSVSAHVPRPHVVAYTATKHAITGLTKTIALEGREYDICCTQIDIGNAAIQSSSRMEKGMLQGDGTVKPEARMAVTNVSKAILFIMSLPLEANVPFINIMANKMPFIGRG